MIITAAQAGQRIDNFLIAQLKGVPKTRIYRALRKGEVRVNKKRVQPAHRLQVHDEIRIPPIRMSNRSEPLPPSLALKERLLSAILYEDADMLILNKPAGLSVHGGSGVQFGLIEAFRQIRSDVENLYLIHRLDKDTSGCLLLAKHRDAMLALQTLFRSRAVSKLYLLLIHGHWPAQVSCVKAPLLKVMKGDERVVVVDQEGKPAETQFEVVQYLSEMTVLRARLVTGRMHQIRVHAAYVGHPIVGDRKYGDREKDKAAAQKMDEKRLFLHAEYLSFQLSGDESRCVSVMAPGFSVPTD